MNPATRPPDRRGAARLLVIDAVTGSNRDAMLSDLPALLRAGDLLVVNDAATLPASLPGRLDGAQVELRLLAHISGRAWRAVLFGPGDWRTPTENRPSPPIPATTGRIDLGKDLVAVIRALSPRSSRLLEVELLSERSDVLERIYALGRPVQYAYLEDDLALWAVQTSYSSRPWAVEMPSAGRPLSWTLLSSARRLGIRVARITHAAGLSSTGDPNIDSMLPLPERYEIPSETVEAISAARSRGGRVIAVGTTVVRALEGAAAAGGIVAGSATTDLRIDEGHELQVVDGLLTGMHDPDQSHFELVSAFAERHRLLASWNHAVAEDYRCHEFGDLTLVLPP